MINVDGHVITINWGSTRGSANHLSLMGNRMEFEITGLTHTGENLGVHTNEIEVNGYLYSQGTITDAFINRIAIDSSEFYSILQRDIIVRENGSLEIINEDVIPTTNYRDFEVRAIEIEGYTHLVSRLINSSDQSGRIGEIEIIENIRNGYEINHYHFDMTNRISGTIWIDENEDGRLDDEEERKANFEVGILNLETEEYELITTNNLGEFILENILPGRYAVAILVDQEEFLKTEYRAEGVEEERASTGYIQTETMIVTESVEFLSEEYIRAWAWHYFLELAESERNIEVMHEIILDLIECERFDHMNIGLIEVEQPVEEPPVEEPPTEEPPVEDPPPAPRPPVPPVPPRPTPPVDPKDPPAAPSAPARPPVNTGDNTNMFIYIGLMATAAVGYGTYEVIRRVRKNKQIKTDE